MPLQATFGAASYDAFGGGVPVVPNYIEEVFSTYLYTGNGGTQTIANDIDLSTKGGMVWLKSRQAVSHALFTTAQGAGTEFLSSNRTDTIADATALTSFNTTGFTLGAGASGWTNTSPQPYVSWTFRKQPKFFDVVTWTGNATTRTIAHNLGSVPGCIIIKRRDDNSDWTVYHRGVDATAPADYSLFLNTTAARNSSQVFNFTAPTSTEFTIYSSNSVNASGGSFIAYVFAHDAGGFGLTNTDNVISCGSFTTDGAGSASVTLGYEPQWVLIKYNSNDSWRIFDNMRGMSQTNWAELYPNTSDAEVNRTNQTNLFVRPNSTGFTTTWSPQAGNTAIYIAIRRGPMKVPTVGTSVFSTTVQTGVNTSAGQFITTGFPPDLSIEASAGVSSGTKWTVDRLRGNNQFLDTATTSAESSLSPYGINYTTSSVGVQNVDYGTSAISYVDWLFRRAPSFFDEVCYTGDSTGGRSITHNLGVVPEILIVKKRSSGAGWPTLITSAMRVMEIDNDSGYRSAGDTKFYYGDGSSAIAPTSSVFTVASGGDVNGSGSTYVAYLFASCLGVSKVGAYTGNGSTQTINCGFTGGARFVLIKRTDTNGEWYVYDTARGMTSGTAPYTSLDNSGGSTATAGSVTTVSTGFAVNASVLAAINTNAASYIFLAIA